MTPADAHLKRVLIPRMSDHAFVFAGVMRGMDIDAEVLPEPDDESMALGLATCRGRECLPCFLVTGDLLKKCREPGFDFGETVFFLPQTQGACRFGQYSTLQKQILAEEGFPDVHLVSPSSANSYTLFGDNPLLLRKRAWQGIVAVDLLTKLLHETRPYEIEPGSADALYEQCLALLVHASERGCGEALIETLAEIGHRFRDFPVDRSEERPLIGVIGEIYLVLNGRANLELVRAIERGGGEVLRGNMSEYIHYVDWKRQSLALRFGLYRDFLKSYLTEAYQVHWERRLVAPVKAVLRHPVWSPTDDSMREVRRHYEPLLGTEAVLTMGTAYDVFRHGVAGIVNVLPFSCMPGTIVSSMAPVLRRDMEGVPWLDIAFDGQKDTNIHTRLGAFIHQAQQFHRRVVRPRRKGATPAAVAVRDPRADGRPEPMRGEAAPRAEPFSRTHTVRGLVLFGALSVLGLGTLFWLTGGLQGLGALRGVSLWMLAAIVVTSLLDVLVGALRYFIFLRKIKQDMPFGLAVRAQFANRFGAALTPSQSGGGPAFLYVFCRGGIPLPDAVSVLVVNFLATLVFFYATSLLATLWLWDRLPSAAAGHFIRYGFVAFSLMAGLLLVGLVRPHWLARPLSRVGTRLARRDGPWRAALASGIDRLSDSIDRYHATCLLFLKKAPGLLALSLGLTVLMYGLKFSAAWLVVRGLGVHADFVATLAVLALIHFVLYLAPTPGGSGVAELSTGALMTFLLPNALLGVFTLIYRFFLMVLPAAVGALVLAEVIRAPVAAGSRDGEAVLDVN